MLLTVSTTAYTQVIFKPINTGNYASPIEVAVFDDKYFTLDKSGIVDEFTLAGAHVGRVDAVSQCSVTAIGRVGSALIAYCADSTLLIVSGNTTSELHDVVCPPFTLSESELLVVQSDTVKKVQVSSSDLSAAPEAVLVGFTEPIISIGSMRDTIIVNHGSRYSIFRRTHNDWVLLQLNGETKRMYGLSWDGLALVDRNYQGRILRVLSPADAAWALLTIQNEQIVLTQVWQRWNGSQSTIIANATPLSAMYKLVVPDVVEVNSDQHQVQVVRPSDKNNLIGAFHIPVGEHWMACGTFGTRQLLLANGEENQLGPFPRARGGGSYLGIMHGPGASASVIGYAGVTDKSGESMLFPVGSQDQPQLIQLPSGGQNRVLHYSKNNDGSSVAILHDGAWIQHSDQEQYLKVQNFSVAQIDARAIKPQASGLYFVPGGAQAFYWSTDRGVTWSETRTPGSREVARDVVTSANYLYVVTGDSLHRRNLDSLGYANAVVKVPLLPRWSQKFLSSTDEWVKLVVPIQVYDAINDRHVVDRIVEYTWYPESARLDSTLIPFGSLLQGTFTNSSLVLATRADTLVVWDHPKQRLVVIHNRTVVVDTVFSEPMPSHLRETSVEFSLLDSSGVLWLGLTGYDVVGGVRVFDRPTTTVDRDVTVHSASNLPRVTVSQSPDRLMVVLQGVQPNEVAATQVGVFDITGECHGVWQPIAIPLGSESVSLELSGTATLAHGLYVVTVTFSNHVYSTLYMHIE